MSSRLRRALAQLAGSALAGFCRGMTDLTSVWLAPWQPERPRIFFMNHTSHADTALAWAALPPSHRQRLRPVAAAAYWSGGPLRRFLAQDVFRTVPVARHGEGKGEGSVRAMAAVIASGDSLLIFPEGTRNRGQGLLPFRPGLFHLHLTCPETDLQPVWVDNPSRGMPKGALLPVPLFCKVVFGPLLTAIPGEGREAFLARAQAALLAQGETP